MMEMDKFYNNVHRKGFELEVVHGKGFELEVL